MRVVVVGSGMAGVIAAVRARRHHEVILITKADVSESATRYAQGGIAAAIFPDDDVELHIADTLAAGAGMCNEAAVRVLCGEGPARIADLLRLGVKLDHEAGPDSPLARGHEAAHSVARILHGGGDQSGVAIEYALLRALRAAPVEVHEQTMLLDLVVEPGLAGLPQVTGVMAAGPAGEQLAIAADAVVIATGGAGHLFPFTTNPPVTTGDGVAVALRAGAAVADLEFYQFHPTALATRGTPLISEAVRGEGAVLIDEAGRRFMLDLHPDGELAPRDVVARGIRAAMLGQGGRPVLLDATGLGRKRLEARFPAITARIAASGLDWAAEPVPVTPAAHYWMGGIATDLSGRASLRGLWAIGEAASTGAHGANRLASNSLLESLVFAWRAADALSDEANWPERPEARPLPMSEAATDVAAEDVSFSRVALQNLMWEHVNLERDAAGLAQAAALVAQWQAATEPLPAGGTVAAMEDRNLLDLAQATIIAAAARTESRGAHTRRDFWDTDPAQAHSVAWRRTTSTPLTLGHNHFKGTL
ncbi:MAG: L-aspartate oxidase [Promicromonosporaceae bacterium]|nr:L-aspartate oxidase [Promicromonosporaceae bacterium]